MINRIVANTKDNMVTPRDQAEEDQHRKDNPHIADGWNAMLIQDIIKGAFVITAAQARRLYPTQDCYDVLHREEAEEAAPGLTEAIRKAVKNHRISDRLHHALYDESRELAASIIRSLNPEETGNLTDLTLRNVDEISKTDGDPNPRFVPMDQPEKLRP